MSGLFKNFNMMNDTPKVVLFLAALTLWFVCFTANKKSLESLKSNNMSEMKTQVEQLRNYVWALYAVYLLQYLFSMYKPVSGTLSGNTNIGIVGIILTTVIVMCITHVSNVCTTESCDMKTAESSLNRINILFSVLAVVHIGTLVVIMMSPSSKVGFTAEILDLLRTPSRRSSLRRSPLIHGSIDYE
jgi:hypothetical protein